MDYISLVPVASTLEYIIHNVTLNSLVINEALSSICLASRSFLCFVLWEQTYESGISQLIHYALEMGCIRYLTSSIDQIDSGDIPVNWFHSFIASLCSEFKESILILDQDVGVAFPTTVFLVKSSDVLCVETS